MIGLVRRRRSNCHQDYRSPLRRTRAKTRPVRVWEAVAKVNGRILEIHPRLLKVSLIGKDELLLRIEPTEYELAVSQVQADILSTRAQLSETGVKEANTRASLAIEEESLALREGRVYLLEDGRLVIRPVDVQTVQPEYAVIASGIEPGAPVIVSDLVPAIEGMRLEGQPDPEALERLIADAGARE